MNYEKVYREVWEIVWSYRNRLSDVWPTPPPLDCLRFAVTEAAEVIDAELRQNPIYARNNDKDLDPLDEVADCLMMLCSTMSEYQPLPAAFFYYKVGPATSEKLVHMCALALISANCETGETFTFYAICIALIRLGESAPNRVEERLKRIERKVLSNSSSSSQ